MAIELHHLNTHGMMEQAGKVLDGVVRLKARIAELEARNHDLEEERRLRKASEELPIDNDDVYVILENGFKTTDRYDHDKGHWHCHWYTVKYWMPLPSAPKEEE